MCLGPEFFDEREEAIRIREGAGEIEVEHFMRSKRLRFGLLEELGYLQDSRETFSTADIFLYQIPKEAEVFLSEDSDLQLVYVRANQGSKLASRLGKKIRAVDLEIP